MRRAIAEYGWWVVALAWLFALASGCNRSTPSPAGTRPARAAELRIVSLSPAISRTLVDLGLADHVVGRTPYCTSLEAKIPVVGDLQNVNYEQLIRLKPSHILVQPPSGGVDAHLQEIAQRNGWVIGQSHLDSLQDIAAMLKGLPATLVPEDSPLRRDIEQRAAGLLHRLEHPEPGAGHSFRGRVLIVNGVDPVLAFGAGTYLDDVLTNSSAQNAVRDRGWVQLSLEDVVHLGPEAIILVKPGATEKSMMTDLGPLATLDMPAVKTNRLATLGHPDALLPSSAVVDVVREMRQILDRFALAPSTQDNQP